MRIKERQEKGIIGKRGRRGEDSENDYGDEDSYGEEIQNKRQKTDEQEQPAEVVE